MWNSILLSWQLIAGVLVMFALFMGALMMMERGAAAKNRKRTEQAKPAARVIRIVRCEGQDRAA
ncbi:MAG: hypothetical protein AAGU77_09820 [Bacillota bacterium]